VKHPGTFAHPRKNPYLKGVNCVELMPVYEFDEFENSRPNPETGNVIELLGLQYGWFLCAQGWLRSYRQTGMQVDEFKALSKTCTRMALR